MAKIKSLFKTIHSSFGRFAGMYLLCFLDAIFGTVFTFSEEKDFIPFVMDFSWMIVFAVLLKLAFEKFSPIQNAHSKPAKIMVNLIPVVLSVPFYFFCKSVYETTEYLLLIYSSTFASMIFGIAFFLAGSSKEKNLPNVIVSGFISSVMMVCFGGPLSLIIFAIHTLIVDLGENCGNLVVAVWIFSFCLVYVGAFVSYSTKKYEEIQISKAFKVIFHYTLLPLLAVYILVLYIYFLKALFTQTMPAGFVNPFVSGATCAYMILYFCLEGYKNSVTKFMRKYGSLFLIPLIALQIGSFKIRVDAYGFTMPRYMSMLYILFTVIFVGLTVAKGLFNAKLNLQKIFFLILAALSIWICLPKVNLIDFTDRSMKNQLEKIYKSHGLFENGQLVTKDADSIFNNDEKNQIRDINNNIEITKNIPWYKNSFEETYGFKNHWYSSDEDRNVYYDYGCNVRAETKTPVNIEGFKNLEIIDNAFFFADSEPTLTLKTLFFSEKSNTYVLKDEINEYLEHPYADDGQKKLPSPLIVDYDENTRIVITRLRIKRDVEYPKLGTVDVVGYVLKK